MKKFLLTLAAVLCCTMTTTVFTACGSDDDDIKPNDTNQKSVVTIYYYFNLSDDLLDFYDISCYYTDVDGKVQEKQCTVSGSYKYNNYVDYDKAPENYEFSVIGKLKDKLPEIYPDSVYDFTCPVNINVSVRPSADSQDLFKIIMTYNPINNGNKTKGKNLSVLLKEEKEIVKKQTGTKQ